MFRLVLALIAISLIVLFLTKPGPEKAETLFVERVQAEFSATELDGDASAAVKVLAGTCRLFPSQCSDGIRQMFAMQYTNHYVVGVLDVSARQGGSAATCLAVFNRLICHETGE